MGLEIWFGLNLNKPYDWGLCIKIFQVYPNTPNYIEVLYGENYEEHYKAMDIYIKSIIVQDTRNLVPKSSNNGK